ncbi:type II secretion system F family protein [Lutibacter sp. HS1-25]|uniref:type II secretion system F family protein n=1 Tax=Lutibacter sp. HS1-25 TaxID=2485000 RepID=UPI001011C884|nr:type II secretion system F family protein [Lutibacter sp. HS1-25]RXP46376.1 type II secretion system F family protein [Lutibacter sp. HS1-25]
MAFNLEQISKVKKVDIQKTTSIQQLLKKEIVLFGSSFSNKKKEAFYSELSVLLNAGITLKDSLTLISEEQKKVKDREVFDAIIENIVYGKSLSEAIKQQALFTEYEYYSLKIGEETGSLEKVTTELGNYYTRKNEQRRTILNALSYPIIVMITALLAVVFMLQFVVPMFVDIFKQNNVELPWITKVIVALSESFQENFWNMIVFIILLFVLKAFISKKIWYQKTSSKILLKLPYIGELLRKIYISQFTQATALLVGAKVPLLNCIQLTKKMIAFYPLQEALSHIEKDIVQGKELSASLSNYPIFDRKMISLLKVAEQTNQSEFIFEKLTKQYNDDIQHQSKLLSTVLEPFIMIFLGTLVATILIAMYLPMFKLSTVIG